MTRLVSGLLGGGSAPRAPVAVPAPPTRETIDSTPTAAAQPGPGRAANMVSNQSGVTLGASDDEPYSVRRRLLGQ
jgi:hypothetical protein